MASSGNFATLNPLSTRNSSASSQITNGNLQYNGQSTQDETDCTTISIGNNGVPKVYFEVYIINNHDTGWLGIYDTNVTTMKADSVYGTTSYRAMKFSTGQKVTGSTSSNYIGDGSENNSRSGQTVGVAIDVPNGKIWFAYNNAWGGDGGGSPTDSNVAFTDLTTTGSYMVNAHMGGASVAQPDWCFNFGQDSTFQGRETAGGNADANGFGNFRYAPPSGFVALCSANMNISEDIDPNKTDDDIPTKQFGVVTYTGNGGTNSITGLGFQPDFVWAKSRSATQSNRLYDSSRGVSTHNMLFSDTNAVAQSGTDLLTTFGTDGFTYGTSGSNANDNTVTYVAWCWRANGGTTSTNTDGTATSTVQANTKAGFSISLTDNYTSATGVTIGHGLGKAPAFYINKPTGNNTSGGSSQAFNWHVYHQSLGGTKALILNTNSSVATAIGYFNNTDPTSTVLSIGNTMAGNGQILTYAWAEIEGFSRFGSYKGNANNDGPFVYCGFRPRLIFLKETGTSDDWVVYDTERDPINRGSSRVSRWESDTSEFDGTSRAIDILANGFKIRTSNNTINQSSNFVFGAWGDVPFKYNNVLP